MGFKYEDCTCHQCIKDHDIRCPDTGWPLNSTRMILCPDCGNKRCPKASNHRFDCTNSNEPDQVGTISKNE